MKKHSGRAQSEKNVKIINLVFLLKLCDPSTCAELRLNGKMASFTVHKEMEHIGFFHIDHP